MVTVEANAKINLTLDILGKRPDGYHEVAMVMQTVGLHDTLTLEKREQGISLNINVPWLKADEKNLAWRAAALVQEEFGLTGGVHIELIKRIPVAAGLAGGSADAAAVLKGMSELYGLNLSDNKLCELGAKLGSDIPFCLLGGTMLATGRGEVLKRLPDMPETWVVLVKPRISVSTAWAYQNYDEQGAERHPDNEAIQKEIARGNRKGVAKLLCNVLESVTINKYDVIERYKQMMLAKGAMASMMSGSGPTVFALAKNREQAEEIAGFMRQEKNADVFVTRTFQLNRMKA
ncbi:MAG: 4-(cytidine 5'-diphospho)-2-C-methyl-D-erythritol kinase [Selenomonas sp.]|jgi:4-diphosphocytidyl-2-C-methyl-D-erythritol kinase|uniref:4-(cytidine 5'-diphospho)-2-C-methyl-D-erythritol kinase n=1 Tax=Selenomonas sp. AE3005 TaxID=1485543 RepID=UPI000480EA2D|nr:4-(cytidine 5'-diphospho)-2-C-methyl-D-erythritol kinase [Selenomonas sp. AE3005]MBQ1415704.1 4-(cytidine 5'-diphospho)-2-C-methyl-D-erythritol kinase [Selenomonas sp.]MBQ1460577.1 4-(cytidine 5'-diphospho)-2-C-methyl-D-erythritol kinase [Selenomonas sp.]MBQ1615578.1 4-(cytidine 5'-diphospho)-2-C-methyl-D-erythritol kinase [Selenomonas sp.]MBQ1920742.1 4-(cytidine 5'-diphospho)-2-C-methyl-D-erythritol kinase [Selenomonas sp.]MBQ2088013.1 4-(cytidine 5'-diphospho)-2-C-methyl-D-erythritol kin